MRRPLIILDLPNLKICTVEKIQRRYPARGRLMQRAAVPEVARADDGVDEVWTLGMMSVRYVGSHGSRQEKSSGRNLFCRDLRRVHLLVWKGGISVGEWVDGVCVCVCVCVCV